MNRPDPRPGLLPVSPWAIGAFLLGTLVMYAVLLRRPSVALAAWAATIGVVILVATARRGRPSGKSPASSSAKPLPLPRTETAAFPLVLTVEEAADLLRIRQDLIIEAIRESKLPGNHIDQHWRVRTEALITWLDGTFGKHPEG